MLKIRRPESDAIQLNLNPMMDLFVALLPFLILSTAFVRYGGIETHAPAAATTKQTIEQKTQEVWLSFEVEEKKVTVTGYTKNFEAPRAGLRQSFAMDKLDDLKSYLASVAKKNEKLGP